MHLENSFLIKPGFLKNHTEITPDMRSVLVEWINEVHSELNLSTESYFLAISIIDRYTQMVADLHRKNYQLVGTTALFIANKVNHAIKILNRRKFTKFIFYSTKRAISEESENTCTWQTTHTPLKK